MNKKIAFLKNKIKFKWHIFLIYETIEAIEIQLKSYNHILFSAVQWSHIVFFFVISIHFHILLVSFWFCFSVCIWHLSLFHYFSHSFKKTFNFCFYLTIQNKFPFVSCILLLINLFKKLNNLLYRNIRGIK